MRAAFLDRDGTINREVDNLRDVRQLRLLPGAAEAVKKLNREGFLVIVVTNQPVIARGWLTEQELERIHDVLLARLAKRGARIDAIYYCPHHPEANLQRYRVRCRCRKPNIGLFKKASRDFKIALNKKSYMVGDHSRDILTGKRAGLTAILVKTGYKGKDGKYAADPDFEAKSLTDAVSYICRQKRRGSLQ